MTRVDRTWSPRAWTVILIGLGLYAGILYRTSWLDDDAHITFRVVDNLFLGHGLRWNTAERVQAFTHPLWMMATAAAYGFTREFFLTVQILSILISMAAVAYYAFRIALSARHAALGLAVLLLSKSFVEYSTSGLETPLTFLLLALFFGRWLTFNGSSRGVLGLSLTAGLLVLNRMDCVLLIAPALLWAVSEIRPWKPRLWIPVLAGALPFAVWEVFSLVYYGFPFPNTAYAKLGTGFGHATLMLKGVGSFANQWRADPLSMAVLLAAGLCPILLRRKRLVSASLGVAAYLAYIVWIGGDFMLGRMFTAPLFVAVIVLSSLPGRIPPRLMLTDAVAVIGLGILAPNPAFLTGKSYGTVPLTGRAQPSQDLNDERHFYYQGCGLRHYQRGAPMPRHDWFVGLGTYFREAPGVWCVAAIGMAGLGAGPANHIVDVLGLADPLLARLPAAQDRSRVGHYWRNIPAGYLDTLRSGKDCFLDRRLAAFYKELALVVRGPLFTRDRWAAIWRLNTGRLDGLIDRTYYARNELAELTLGELTFQKHSGAHRDLPDVLRVSPDLGLTVRLREPVHFPAFDVSLDTGTSYEFSFDTIGAGIIRTDVTSPPGSPEHLARTWVDVPRAAWEPGYRSVHIVATDPMRRAIGHLIPAMTGSRIHVSSLGTARQEHAHPREVNAVEVLPGIPLRVELGGLRKPRWIDVSFDFDDAYLLAFNRNGERIATTRLEGPPSFGGLSRLIVQVPQRVRAEGTDEIQVEVLRTDGYASIGHLILDPRLEGGN